MTVRAKTLVKDKFWIVEEHGQKLGTLQKKDDNVPHSKSAPQSILGTSTLQYARMNATAAKTKETLRLRVRAHPKAGALPCS